MAQVAGENRQGSQDDPGEKKKTVAAGQGF